MTRIYWQNFWEKISNCLNILIIHITCHQVSQDRTFMRYSRKPELAKVKKLKDELKPQD